MARFPSTLLVLLLVGCGGAQGVGVSIEPAEPTSADALSAVVVAGELDGERLRVVWTRDGDEVAGLDATVPADETRRGERWRAHVWRSRPGPFGGALASAEVTIGNSSPSIGAIRIDPSEPREDDRVAVRLSDLHDEDDDEITVQVRWFAGGTFLHEGDVLPPGYAREGQTLEAVAVPFDGLEDGPEVSFRVGPVRPPFVDGRGIAGDWAWGCWLDEEGRAWCWRGSSFDEDPIEAWAPRPVGGDLRFAEIVSRSTTYAVDRDGGLWGWGYLLNDEGMSSLFREPVPLSVDGAGPIVGVASSGSVTCIHDIDGQVFCWGVNTHGLLSMVTPDWQGPHLRFADLRLARLDLGPEHGCGVDFDGAAWCWGREYRRRLGVAGLDAGLHEPVRVQAEPAAWRRVVPGRSHTCGIDEDRRAWCWGYSAFGQLGSGTGPSDPGPSQVFGRHRWLSVALAEQVSCGLRDDQTLWCWGDGRTGLAGCPEGTRCELPYPIGGGHRWAAVHLAESGEVACAQREEGSVWCWGDRAFAWPPTDESPMRRLPDPVDED